MKTKPYEKYSPVELAKEINRAFINAINRNLNHSDNNCLECGTEIIYILIDNLSNEKNPIKYAKFTLVYMLWSISERLFFFNENSPYRKQRIELLQDQFDIYYRLVNTSDDDFRRVSIKAAGDLIECNQKYNALMLKEEIGLLKEIEQGIDSK